MSFVEFDAADGTQVLVNTDQVIYAAPVREQIGIYRLVIAVLIAPNAIMEHQVLVKSTSKEVANKLNLRETRAGFAGFGGVN